MDYKGNKTAIWAQAQRDRRFWLMPLAVAVAVISLTGLVVIPILQGIREDLAAVEKEKAELTKLVAKRTVLTTLNEAVITEQLKTVNRVLPSRKPVLPLINTLANSASGAGVLLNSYAFDPGVVASEAAEVKAEEKPGELATMSVKSSISGSYDAVLSFLSALGRVAPLMYPENAAFGGALDPAEPSSEPMPIQVMLAAYYALPLKQLGAMSDPLPEMSQNQQTLLTKINEFNDYQNRDALPVTQEFRGNFFSF
ncbi:hypothetical protein A2W24_04705 [Microgenomates group bacterium RBG_16_45_19]|nr:MAG: hypothetical protein A2W24_04705 [Microgenomates group bacterium RBG_16_45_19]